MADNTKDLDEKKKTFMDAILEAIDSGDRSNPLFVMFDEWNRSQRIKNYKSVSRIAENRDPNSGFRYRQALRDVFSTPAERAERISFHGGRTADGSWTNSYDVWAANRPSAEQKEAWNSGPRGFSVHGRPAPLGKGNVLPVGGGTKVGDWEKKGGWITGPDGQKSYQDRRTVMRNGDGTMTYTFGDPAMAALRSRRDAADAQVARYEARNQLREMFRQSDDNNFKDGVPRGYFKQYRPQSRSARAPGWLLHPGTR